MNTVSIIDKPDETVICVNGIGYTGVKSYKVERNADSPIGSVTFTLLCDSITVDHQVKK